MPVKKVLVLMEKYAECPECGSDKLGNGQGTLNIDDGIFERTCKCGYQVRVNEDDKPIERT